jgi:hypothetical protein
MGTSIPTEQMHEVLRQYHGATAMIWQYSASFRRIVLRLYWPRQPEKDLFIVCINSRHITAPVSWEDNHLELAEWDPMGGSCRLVDATAGFELRSGGCGFVVDLKEPFPFDEPTIEELEG